MTERFEMSGQELAQPATKGDIVRLHDKMDKFSESIAKLESRPIYRQPCEFFLAHVAEHKETASDWKKAAVNGVVTIVVSAVLAVLGYFVGVKQ